MNNDCDLLYISFIDLSDVAETGSSVRPQKMFEAFKTLGLNIKVLDGWNNQLKTRKKNVREIFKWLKSNKPKMCYVEPPSGPFFCYMDLILLKKLHKMNVPIGIFYRDAYWKFPEFDLSSERKSFVKVLKLEVIKIMQKRDLRVFSKVCKHIFFPSETMASLFDVKDKSALPPACAIRSGIDYDTEFSRIKKAENLTYFYVGGASVRYGTMILIEAFKKANEKKQVAKLIFVCPENQWKELKNYIDVFDCKEWLNVVHTSGDENLNKLYGKSDVAIVPLLRSCYNDFAVPIKMYEYISYNKPIIATNCTEMEKFIIKNNVGWVVNDNADSLKNKIIEIDSNREEISKIKKNCQNVYFENTWQQRAASVIDILS